VNARRRLARLSPAVRRELLMVLRSPSHVRADLIRQMHERDDTRSLADVLIDLEADELIRFQTIQLLEELDEQAAGGRERR
jgi:hypothetical protein